MAAEPGTWPLSWRIMILLNVSFYNMMGNVFAAGASSLIGLLVEDLHCSTNQAAHLTTYALLMLGVANLLAVPVVGYLGKRYTILISMTVFLAANIWAATAQTYSSLLGSRFLGGISGGIIEALGPVIVSECFVEKQLASAMVVYVGFLAAGSSVGPIVAGGIASGLHDWRWFFIVSSIAIGINLVTCILMLPSTEYAVDNIASANDEGQESKFSGTAGSTGCEIESINETETSEEGLLRIWVKRSFYLRIERVKPREGLLKQFFRLFALLIVPEVLVTTLVFGITIGWTVLTSVLASNLYAMPPKLWQSWQIGLLSFGPLVGLFVGLPVGGALADLVSRRATRKSNGEHDPRSRLPLVLVGGLISPIGCIVIGVSLHNKLDWVGTTVGWGLLCFGLTASANILLTYAVDCHRSRAMDIGVIVNVIKNVIGFGVSYAAIDWYEKYGGLKEYGTMAGILWASYFLVLPLYCFRNSLGKVYGRYFTDDIM